MHEHAPTAPAAPRDATATGLTPRDRLAVTLLLVSTFVVILNETIMGVALPRLMSDLRIDASTGQWLTTAFLLTMAVVIPVTGFLLKRLPTRTVFLVAMSLFSLGTAVCAVAPGFPVLLVGRVVQAGGTAIMLPLLMTTVLTVTPPAARGRTMGNISVVISVAPALGPTISGLILSVLSWRWMFGLVLPIAVAALVLGALRMPNVSETGHARVDVLSVVLSALAFGPLVFWLSSLGEGGGTAAWAAFAVGAVAMVAFVLRQLRLQRTAEPLLDLRVLAVPNFRIGTLLMAVMMMCLFGTIILFPIYAQQVLGASTLTTGLVLLPGGLLMGLLAPTVGRVYDRVGPRPLLVPGALVVSAALWGTTLLGEDGALWQMLVVHVLLSAGLALVFTPLFTSSLGALPAPRYASGSAVVSTVQQVAGAAGTALFVSVLAARSTSLAGDGASELGALAGGIHAALLVGAVISLLAAPVAFFVRPVPPGADPVTRSNNDTKGVVALQTDEPIRLH
ncbi:MDR family MFS transporter [Cellulomonas marina]|uniref:MFS transporter, DHA2 family, lincomycin resistance protein n=1 Tax=Cellulomonas marina TaxID=988821 RepID=A0A1I0WV52_9CELL|nr:MDR family MFS transporter [Cellulomonas marina]GIG30367.1 MFS transporter [Cellulomonas marina]SFA92531.1 MFS transporter, DHA2 family, lincomycin resistance protein [Cellulomonas marina]